MNANIANGFKKELATGVLLCVCTFMGFSQTGVGVNTSTPKSSFEVNGSFGKKVTTITANTTLDNTHATVVCNNGATAISVTLPAANTCAARIYEIKRNAASTNTVTIVGTIDGAADYLLNKANQAVTVFSDGTNWLSRDDSREGLNWSITGNSGTTAGTNFIGTLDAQDIVFKTNNTEKARLQNVGTIGYFGVGTSNPSTIGRISILSDGTGSGRQDDFGIASYNTSPSPTILFFSSRGTSGTPSNSSSGDTIFSILGSGQINGSMQATSRILSQYKGTGANNASNLTFWTSGYNQRMMIDENGNVGIGTSTPNSKLEVNGSFAAGVFATSGSKTLDDSHFTVIVTNSGHTITLPAANSCTNRIYNIVNINAGTPTISTYKDLTGGNSTTIPANTGISIASDGSNWRRFK